MIAFFVKFWESLKKFVLGLFGMIIFIGATTWNSVKRTYENFSNNVKILWKFIVTGDVGDLAVQPSLIAVLVYLFFSSRNEVPQIYDPGDYSITLVGWVGKDLGKVASDKLISLIAEYQMISNDEALQILNVDNLKFNLAYGVKEGRANYLKSEFESAGGILEIVRVGIDENLG